MESRTARKTLTTRFLDTLVCPPDLGRVEVADDRQTGLVVRAGKRSKTWLVQYRVKGGAWKRKTLGRYPDLSLADARAAAGGAMQAARAGVDPIETERAEHAAADEAKATAKRETFGALAELFMERHSKKRKRTWAEDARILRKDLLPVWGDTPVRSITRRAVREHLDTIADRAPVSANRALALASTIFNFGVDREWIEANPAHRIKKPAEEASRDRVLSDDEIRHLWASLHDAGVAYDAIASSGRRVTGARLKGAPLLRPMLADWLRLRLLTAQRGGEVIRMRWSDLSRVDKQRVWTIPADVAKNGRAHVVPLTPAVITILARRRRAVPRGSAWVFPNDRLSGPAVDRAKKVKLAALIPASDDVRGHDLRRTAASGLGRLGIARETIAHVLNHVDRGPRATAIYDRYDRVSEKRRALEAWARHVDRVIAGAPASKVVAFGR